MNEKILLVSYRLGMSDLLYWDCILSAIKMEFNNFRVFTAFPELETKDKSVRTELELMGLKFYRNIGKTNARLVYIPMPFFVFKIYRMRPDLLVLNEFNLSCLYALLFNRFINKGKTLLLVESDPFVGYENRHSRARTVIRKWMVKKCDTILTNNTLGYSYLTNVLSANSEKVIVSPYLSSVPPADDDIQSIEETRDVNIRFLYVGQLIERKGLLNVMKAINSLPRQDQVKIQFDIIGKGNFLDDLVGFKKSNNLECVNFLGFRDYGELANIYAQADCFILNTLHDYRALVGFEALNSGCAIIGSMFDGARFEIIQEGKNGYIVHPENINEIKVAISKLVRNPELLKDFKKHSRSIAKAFTTKKVTQNIIAVLKSQFE